MIIPALAALTPKTDLIPFKYERGVLAPLEVEIRISHCGICHSDIHLIDNDWGISAYPLVPGHEIIGAVAALGSKVSHLAIGQRVGIGWQCGSCGQCDYCKNGEENFCARQQATCVGHHGGFADRVRADSHFVFPIPENLASENAAPLLCGGITVYNPLRTHKVGGGTKVGIIGIGGLGHLALQFAHALGAEVTAFSSSKDKEEETRQFGADHFVIANPEPVSGPAAYDFLLSTVSADIPWNSYINLLRPQGKLCVVGASPGPMNIFAGQLISGAKMVCGSPIGPPAMIREMLEFAARHGIKAVTQSMPMHQANEALAQVRKGCARYRMVLVNL